MTKIIADTTSGLPIDLAAELGIVMIPQLVIFGEDTYRDDNELTTADFLQKLRGSSILPKTAAPPPHFYKPAFEHASRTGETLLVLAPSSKISGTVRSVQVARQDFLEADIRIIDTQTVAGCLGMLVLNANKMVQDGKSADEIEAYVVSQAPLARTFFVVDTLEYLKKGGRIGAAKALLGELLQVKPILQIKDGQAAPFEQERTKKRATARMMEIVCEQISKIQEKQVCVMHIDAQLEALDIALELSSRLGIKNIPLYLLPPAIVVHAGPKALAVGFFA